MRLFHKYPGLPLWSGSGIAQKSSSDAPPWPVLSGRWCLTDVAFRIPEVVWSAGDKVRFREFGRGSSYVMEGTC